MNLITRLNNAKQAGFEIGQELGYQQAMDFMCMALNDPDCMGTKGVLGNEKITKIALYALALDKLYFKAFTPRDPEADVYQERMDAKLRKVFKEKFQRFYERYPCIKKCEYEVRKRK